MTDKADEKVDIPSLILSIGVATTCMAIGLAVASPMGDNPAVVVTDNYLVVVGSFAAILVIISVVVPLIWHAACRHSK